MMDGKKAWAFRFDGEIEWGGVAGFAVETEFVDAFAGIRTGVGADINGEVLRVQSEGDEQGDGGKDCFHGAPSIGNWKLQIGNSNRFGLVGTEFEIERWIGGRIGD